jgi:hypothetical protein
MVADPTASQSDQGASNLNVRPQFGLRSLFILTAFVAVGCLVGPTIVREPPDPATRACMGRRASSIAAQCSRATPSNPTGQQGAAQVAVETAIHGAATRRRLG